MIALTRAVRFSRETVGGKALRLAQVLAAGFPVKPAMILSVDEVQGILAANAVPEVLLLELTSSLNLNGTGVAVRSSGVSEDGGKLSWAGQFRSQLFVQANELAPAIIDCAKAQNGEQAQAYAQTHGTEIAPLALAVQEMVDAEMAGVLYTCEPVTGDSDFMVIETVEGVAEKLVSGEADPRRYVIETTSGRVLIEEGSPNPRLSRVQIAELVRIGKGLRDEFGTEQDVEWAVEKETGKVFVNQSRDNTGRPTTASGVHRAGTIRDLSDELETEAQRLEQLGCELLPDTLTNQNVIELLTSHPTRMTFGLFTYGFAHGLGGIRTGRNQMGYDIGPELQEGFFRLAAGKPMCSIAHDAFTYRIKGIPLSDYCKLVNYYLERVAESPELASYPELVLYNQNPSFAFLARMFDKRKAEQYRAAYDEFLAGIRRMEETVADEFRHEFLPAWDKAMDELTRAKTGDTITLTKAYRATADAFRTLACPMYVKIARLAFFVDVRLKRVLRELFGENAGEYYNTLTAGTSAEDNPLLGFAPALRAWREGNLQTEELMRRFGHLGNYEMEISRTRYHEDPIDALAILAGKVGAAGVDDSALRKAGAELRAKLVADAGMRGAELDHEIEVARTYQPLREACKYHFLRAYDLLRSLSLRLNDSLCWPEGLIFHLEPTQVFQLENDDPTARSALEGLATAAQKDWEDHKGIFVPPVVDAEQLENIGCVPLDLGGRLLQGTPVSNAVAEGEIVVIPDLGRPETRNLIRKGCILVTETTCQAWSMYLDVVGQDGAIVTEFGGQLSHAAMYCRERNIAGAVGVPLATRRLETGMRVRVDGRHGTVEILS